MQKYDDILNNARKIYQILIKLVIKNVDKLQKFRKLEMQIVYSLISIWVLN